MFKYDEDYPINAIPMDEETRRILNTFMVKDIKDLKTFKEYITSRKTKRTLKRNLNKLFNKYLQGT